MCMFGGRVKMCEFCGYAFWKSKTIQAKNVRKVRQNRLFTTAFFYLDKDLCMGHKYKRN